MHMGFSGYECACAWMVGADRWERGENSPRSHGLWRFEAGPAGVGGSSAWTFARFSKLVDVPPIHPISFGVMLLSPLAAVYVCAYTRDMEYEWDEQKAASNVVKRGIDFADAATAFEDEAAVTIVDEFADEERFITIGMDALGRLLVVVYTCGVATIRLISARKATRQERQQYEG